MLARSARWFCSKRSLVLMPAIASVLGLLVGTGPTNGADAAQEAKNLADNVNNLKMIAIGLHGFAGAYRGTLPASASCDAKGKPMTSWRVYLAPFVGGEEILNEYKFDEPWDSDSNKKLLKKMPAAYARPGDPDAAKGITHYRGFAGKHAAFAPPAALKDMIPPGFNLPKDFTDGLANTILVADAADGVPWTKPDEIVVDDADKALPKFGGLVDTSFHAAFGDGQVRFFPKSVDQKSLRALISRDGGEKVDLKELGIR
jgi:hypothetical protein